MTPFHTPYYENIEAAILQRFDTVNEIGVFQNHNDLQAIIYPDFTILKGQEPKMDSLACLSRPLRS